jgi:O-antigen ligase
MFVSGVAEDKNMLGMLCLVFGLGAWWRLLGAFRDRRGKKRTQILIAHGVLLSMVLWLFWMADSMTSLSCFSMAAGVIVMPNLFRFARKPIVVHILVATVICVSFSVLFFNIGGGALATMGRNSTLTGRTDIWQGLLTVGSNPVFGTGFQSFWVGEHLRKVWSMGGLLNGINEAHNGYLEIYLNLGWIGLVLLAGLLVTRYSYLINGVRRDPVLGTLWVGFFTTAIIYGFTEASGFGIMNPVWFAFLMAVTKVPTTRLATESSSAPSVHDRAWHGKELELNNKIASGGQIG